MAGTEATKFLFAHIAAQMHRMTRGGTQKYILADLTSGAFDRDAASTIPILPVEWDVVEAALHDVGVQDASGALLSHLGASGMAAIVVQTGGVGLAIEANALYRLRGRVRGFDSLLEAYVTGAPDDEPSIVERVPYAGPPVSHVLVKTWYPNGSIASTNWSSQAQMPLLRALLKLTVLTAACAFEAAGFLHGNLHAGNVLIEDTESKSVYYDFLDGRRIEVTTHGAAVVMDDLQYSTFHSAPDSAAARIALYSDLASLFARLTRQVPLVDKRACHLIGRVIGDAGACARRLSSAAIDILAAIDTLDLDLSSTYAAQASRATSV